MAWAPTIPPPPVRPAVTGWFALLRSLAGNTLALQNAALVKGIIVAAQSFSLTNAGSTKGLSQATQSMTVQDMAAAIGKQLASQQFSVTDAATMYGAPQATEVIPIFDFGSVIGIVLAPQQVSLLTEGLITGFEGTLSANQNIPIVDAATVKGLQAAGQSFTVIDSATLKGILGASQILAFTESGMAVGVSAASVSLVISNTGTVYARCTAGQTLTLNNSATAIDATVYGISWVGLQIGSSTSFLYYDYVGGSYASVAYDVQPGDVAVGIIGASSTPALPSGWSNLSSTPTHSVSGQGMRVIWKVLTTNNAHTEAGSPLIGYYAILRTASTVGATATQGGTGSTMTFPALTRQVTDGSSAIVRIASRPTGGIPAGIRPAADWFSLPGPLYIELAAPSNPTSWGVSCTNGSQSWRCWSAEVKF